MTEEKQDFKDPTGFFKDPTGLTKWTVWFLYAHVVIMIIAVFSGMLEYQLFSDMKNGVFDSEESVMAAAELSDARQMIVAICQITTLIISAILILKWIYRANYNARQLGANDMKFTPGWSIGWYFIPIAYLWKPYQAMKEIWKASSNPLSWTSQPAPALLPWWWFFWIVSIILGKAAFNMARKAEEINEFITVNIITQISDITFIPACLILISIIKEIHKMQMSHAKLDKQT